MEYSFENLTILGKKKNGKVQNRTLPSFKEMAYKAKILRQTGVMPAHRGHIAILTLCNCYRCSYTGNLDTSVSGRFTERFLHLFFRFIRHIDQSKPIEHPVDVSHSPDIAQSFRSFNYFSYLFNIAQSQQNRTPRRLLLFSLRSIHSSFVYCPFRPFRIS